MSAVLEVEDDGLLVAVGRQEVSRLKCVRATDERRAPPTGVVAVAGGLDLDDAGTEVARIIVAWGPARGARQVDDEGCR
jgi:hypothetical protein